MIAIGYETSVTPLQLIRAASSLASGGLLMQPLLVKAISDNDGRILEAAAPAIVRRVVSPGTARSVLEMMRNVVRSGTGQQAELAGIAVGGKTGTAYVSKAGGGGYSKTRYTTSFIGFLPYTQSNLAILVVIQEPEGDFQGGTLAAPVFRKIARENAIRFFGLPLSIPE